MNDDSCKNGEDCLADNHYENCQIYICSDCSSSHDDSHKLISLEDVQDTRQQLKVFVSDCQEQDLISEGRIKELEILKK